MQKRLSNNAFTISEAVVIMAIIAVICGFGVPKFLEVGESMRAKKQQQNLMILYQASKDFFQDTGRYPEDLDELDVLSETATSNDEFTISLNPDQDQAFCGNNYGWIAQSTRNLDSRSYTIAIMNDGSVYCCGDKCNKYGMADAEDIVIASVDNDSSVGGGGSGDLEGSDDSSDDSPFVNDIGSGPAAESDDPRELDSASPGSGGGVVSGGNILQGGGGSGFGISN